MLGMSQLLAEVVAKLEVEVVEVKRRQSLEDCLTVVLSFAFGMSTPPTSA